MAFSKLKAHLRRIGAHTFTDLFNAIAEICDLYSPDECWNYFKAAGYVASYSRDALKQLCDAIGKLKCRVAPGTTYVAWRGPNANLINLIFGQECDCLGVS